MKKISQIKHFSDMKKIQNCLNEFKTYDFSRTVPTYRIFLSYKPLFYTFCESSKFLNILLNLRF
jgi:hypothetical protein